MINRPRLTQDDPFLDEGTDTPTLLNNAYWLLRELEGTRHQPGAAPRKDARVWDQVTALLNELDKQRWPAS